jgi:hypothetical protein
VISHGWPGTRQTAARVVMLMWTPSSDRCGRRAALTTADVRFVP